jgi:ribosomal protein S18 acetylase RimI-like enzyme
MDFIECVESEQWLSAWPVLRQLRNDLMEEVYLARIAAARREGYRLFVLQIDGHIVGAVGWRIVNDLATGRSLYVDDLVVDSDMRSRGYGTHLLAFAKKRSVAERCNAIRLSSNCHRVRAHAFYERHGFDKRGYSFFFQRHAN